MRLHLVLLGLVWCLYSADSLCPGCTQRNLSYDDDWEKYKVNYDKVYESCFDECKRRVIWEKRCKYIEQFKAGSTYGVSSKGGSFVIAVNAFADWTHDEISKRLFGLKLPRISVSNEPVMSQPLLSSIPPTYFNYTELGYVTPVKNQGGCGNCWAFTAAGAIEGQLYKTYGRLIDVSVQNLNDCCNYGKLYGCYGCRGGWMNGAFRCTNDTGGIVTSDIYSLQRVDQNCSIPEGNHTRYLCTGYFTTVQYDEASLMEALLTEGPIACAIDASAMSFNYYKSGVYSDFSCPRKVNHAVLITGCGTTPDGVNYWMIKNSWGTAWGENGYFRMIRDSNLCDIAHYCSYPVNCFASD